MDIFNSDGTVNVKNIPALKQSFVSKDMVDSIQEEFYNLKEYYHAKYDNPIRQKTIEIGRFKEGWLYSLHDTKQLKYCRIFRTDDPANGNIGYQLNYKNIRKLGFDIDEIEQTILEFIYTPIPSIQHESGESIFSSIDLFFYTHMHEFSDVFSGFTYHEEEKVKIELDFVDIGTDRSVDQIDKIHAHFLPEGIVIIFE